MSTNWITINGISKIKSRRLPIVVPQAADKKSLDWRWKCLFLFRFVWHWSLPNSGFCFFRLPAFYQAKKRPCENGRMSLFLRGSCFMASFPPFSLPVVNEERRRKRRRRNSNFPHLLFRSQGCFANIFFLFLEEEGKWRVVHLARRGKIFLGWWS